MSEQTPSENGIFGPVPSEPPVEDRSPSLRAKVVSVADAETQNVIDRGVPARLTLKQVADQEEFCETVTGNVAVVLLSVTTEVELEPLVKEAVSSSPHARVMLIADDGAQLLQCDVPHDEAVVLPDEYETFQSLVRRVYIRAYYAAATQRYYKVCLSIRSREIQLQPDAIDDDERLEKLRQVQTLLQSYLRQFRGHLKPADMEAMANRTDRLQRLAQSSKNDPDPTTVGLPERCPECDLDWTEWHDQRLRNGYESIGANTWRCTRCGSVLADEDPDNYRVG